jgi:hypothetical protein
MSETNPKKSINPWFIFSLAILLIAGLVVLVLWKKIPPEIPWYYSLPWGESQLMPKLGLPIIIAVSLCVTIATKMLSSWTKKEDKIVEQTVSVSIAFICFLLVINMVKVLFVFI